MSSQNAIKGQGNALSRSVMSERALKELDNHVSYVVSPVQGLAHFFFGAPSR